MVQAEAGPQLVHLRSNVPICFPSSADEAYPSLKSPKRQIVVGDLGCIEYLFFVYKAAGCVSRPCLARRTQTARGGARLKGQLCPAHEANAKP